MFSTLVSGLGHCIQPSYQTVVVISKKFCQVGEGCCRTSKTVICIYNSDILTAMDLNSSQPDSD